MFLFAVFGATPGCTQGLFLTIFRFCKCLVSIIIYFSIILLLDIVVVF